MVSTNAFAHAGLVLSPTSGIFCWDLAFGIDFVPAAGASLNWAWACGRASGTDWVVGIVGLGGWKCWYQEQQRWRGRERGASIIFHEEGRAGGLWDCVYSAPIYWWPPCHSDHVNISQNPWVVEPLGSLTPQVLPFDQCYKLFLWETKCHSKNETVIAHSFLVCISFQCSLVCVQICKSISMTVEIF